MTPPGSLEPSHFDVQHVSYGYSATRGAGFSLADVTLSVGPGSITGLLGPNGSGKTTLLKLLAGILLPSSGAVSLNGRPISGVSRREMARLVGFVPQATHPAFDYTALELVLMGRHAHLGAFALEGPDDIAIAHAAMEATATAGLATRLFRTLSGGEQQRVALASALAQATGALLLDEPTANLDLGFQIEIADLLRTLNRERGVTMVVATHDLQLAARICDHLVLIRDGRVLAQGAPADTITKQTLRALYGVEADIVQDAGGAQMLVVPRTRVH